MSWGCLYPFKQWVKLWDQLIHSRPCTFNLSIQLEAGIWDKVWWFGTFLVSSISTVADYISQGNKPQMTDCYHTVPIRIQYLEYVLLVSLQGISTGPNIKHLKEMRLLLLWTRISLELVPVQWHTMTRGLGVGSNWDGLDELLLFSFSIKPFPWGSG